MSMRVSAAALMQAAKELAVEWDETKIRWSDVKSREFEAAYLQEIPQQVKRAATVIGEIDAALRKVRADCE